MHQVAAAAGGCLAAWPGTFCQDPDVVTREQHHRATTKAPSLAWPWLKVENKEPSPGAGGPSTSLPFWGMSVPSAGGASRKATREARSLRPDLTEFTHRGGGGGQKLPKGCKCLPRGFQV